MLACHLVTESGGLRPLFDCECPCPSPTRCCVGPCVWAPLMGGLHVHGMNANRRGVWPNDDPKTISILKKKIHAETHSSNTRCGSRDREPSDPRKQIHAEEENHQTAVLGHRPTNQIWQTHTQRPAAAHSRASPMVPRSSKPPRRNACANVRCPPAIVGYSGHPDQSSDGVANLVQVSTSTSIRPSSSCPTG